MKSKQVVFADTALNRFKGIVGLPVNNDVIEKARKAEPIGTEKLMVENSISRPKRAGD